jgi:hypothetical protein
VRIIFINFWECFETNLLDLRQNSVISLNIFCQPKYVSGIYDPRIHHYFQDPPLFPNQSTQKYYWHIWHIKRHIRHLLRIPVHWLVALTGLVHNWHQCKLILDFSWEKYHWWYDMRILHEKISSIIRYDNSEG